MTWLRRFRRVAVLAPAVEPIDFRASLGSQLAGAARDLLDDDCGGSACGVCSSCQELLAEDADIANDLRMEDR